MASTEPGGEPQPPVKKKTMFKKMKGRAMC
jgi:hypothetical protein